MEVLEKSSLILYYLQVSVSKGKEIVVSFFKSQSFKPNVKGFALAGRYTMTCGKSFDADSLKSKELIKLLSDAKPYTTGIEIEMVPEGQHNLKLGEIPSELDPCRPTIRFVDSLTREQRIEAIAHELTHLILLFKHRLRIIKWGVPISFYENMHFLLQRITNTTHHLILMDYLKEDYGIESGLYVSLLRNYTAIFPMDKESQYVMGLIFFEREKLGGVVNAVGGIAKNTAAWIAYNSASKHFGNYRFPSIPSSNSYEEEVLSFLEDLGYRRRDFVFCP